MRSPERGSAFFFSGLCFQFHFFIVMRIAMTAAWVMPGMRSAWPIVAGSILASFALSSLESPGLQA
jgi:hypothetical protein